MNPILLSLFFLQAEPALQRPPVGKAQSQMIAQFEGNSKSVMIIDPKARAADYMAAFNLLKQEKSTAKVRFELANGKEISNVIDLKMMPNQTVALFRYSTPQGIQFQVVEIEDIVAITHQ